MKNNESSILTPFNENNNNQLNPLNDNTNNININNSFPNDITTMDKPITQNNEIENEEYDDVDNLRYKGGNNNNSNIKQRLDSSDSTINSHFKFSIDLPNVSKQRLHEYLNDDLLNALEVSPNIPNINNGIQNMKINENENIDNNPNLLFGFSLYPSNAENNTVHNINNQNINNLSGFNINQQNNLIPKGNNNMINTNINNNFKNEINNSTNFNNLNNYNLNYQKIQNNNNLTSNLNINNQMYIPIQMRKKEQNNDKELANEKNIKYPKNKDEKSNNKNKFDKKNAQNSQHSKKEGKMKKPFEVRIGDWTCSKCSNLNFSFRSKCNRCGLPKEISAQQQNMEMIPQDMLNQNINFQMMSAANPNFIYGNNMNNFNEVNYFHK